MEAKAVVKYVRISPQKVRKIAGAVKGKPVEAGLNILKFMPQKAAGFVEKVLRSAVANAEENVGLSRDDLYIASIAADEGPGVLPGKGRRPRFGGRGRYRPIRKRSSHITVVLDELAEV